MNQFHAKILSAFVFITAAVFFSTQVAAGGNMNDDPVAQLSVTPDPADRNEQVRFDATSSYDSDGSIVEYKFDFENDGTYDMTDTDGVVYRTFSSSGNYDTKVKVVDDDGGTDTSIETFRVESYSQGCDINSGFLRLDTDKIREGESTNARINVYNDWGERQEVKVTFKVDGVTVSESTKSLATQETGMFSTSVSPAEDAEITALVDLIGGPCGDQELHEDKERLEVITQPEDAELDVNVEDEDGDPVHNARVDIKNSNNDLKYTDSSGKAGFTLKPDSYNVEVSKDRYSTTTETVTLEDGEQDSITIQIEKRDSEADLNVRVEDTDGNSIENAEVEVTNGIYISQDTDSDGETGFTLNPGSYEVTVSKTGYQLQDRDIELEAGEDRTLVFELREEERNQQDARLRVHVEDDDNRELEDVRVRVENGDTDTEYTDSQGDAEFVLEPGTYEVEASKSGYETEDRTVTLNSGDNRRINFELREDSSLDDARLKVVVEDEDGDKLDDARVRVENGDSQVEYTDNNGEAVFYLDPDNYDVRVSKSGYETEEDSVLLSSGERETLYFTLDEQDSNLNDGRLKVTVRDGEGYRLNNARVRVENGEEHTRYTGNNGEVTLFLKPDRYDVAASKTGYRTEEKSVRIEEDETDRLNFQLLEETHTREDIAIKRVSHFSSVCHGEDLTVGVKVSNNGDYEERLSVGGTGLGSTVADRTFRLDEGETTTKTITFKDVRGSGTERFTVAVTNGDSDQLTRTVNVENCDGQDGGGDDNDDRSVTLDVNPREVKVGESVKVSGYVKGVRGRTSVRVEIDGGKVADVTTQPDGYYQVYIRPDNTGRQSVEVTTGSASASHEINVLPTVEIGSVKAPEKAFQSEQFEVCADVSSQVTPLVVLERDGERIDSKTKKGDVCFDRSEDEVGEKDYTVRASARGVQDSKKRTVNILELDNEIENFPDRVAMVRSGDGIVKVRLYNTGDTQKRYDLSLSGIDSEWFATTDKSVILTSGERKQVFFYLTPKAEGDFTADLEVSTSEGVIYSQPISISSGGTTDGKKKLIDRLLDILRY